MAPGEASNAQAGAPRKAPNLVLRRIREQERHETREQFAEAMTRIARKLNEDVFPDAKYVRRLESGEIRYPRPGYRRILAELCGRPLGELGFTPPPGLLLTTSEPSALLVSSSEGAAPTKPRNHALRDAIMASGLEVSQIARKIGVDPKSIQRWITRGVVPHPRHRWEASRILGKQEKELWPEVRYPGSDQALSSDHASESPRTASLGSDIIIVQMSLNGKNVPVAVNRREFMASAVSLPIVGWVGGTQNVTRIPESISDGDLRDIAKDMISLRVVLTRQDNILGSGVVAPTVTHQLSILKALAEKSWGESREIVMHLQAAYAEFAGWLADELGDRNAGQYWVDRALEWAHQADDELTIGYILARKAQRAIDENEPAAAISLARAARRRSALTDRVLAAALQYEALGHASLGETAEFAASIDHARELAESAPPAEEADWAVWCTPEYVTMHEASGWVRLGKPTRAITAYEQGLTNWPHQFLRDQGVYYSRLARAHAAAGNPEGAASTAQKALNIAIGTGSARILAELRPLPGSLDQWRKSTQVTEFSTCLREVLSTQREPGRSDQWSVS